MFLTFPVLLLLLPCFFLFSSISSRMLRYNGYNLYRIHLSAESSAAERLTQWLGEMEEKAAEEQQTYSNDTDPSSPLPLLDIWTWPTDGAGPNCPGTHADILVAPQFVHQFLSGLWEKFGKGGARIIRSVELLRENIQRDLDRERAGMIQRKRRRRRKRTRRDSDPSMGIDLFSYNPYPKIQQYLRRMVARNPKIAQLVNLSKTFEGRELFGIRIGRTDQDDQPRQLVYIDGGVHAREWIAPAAALYLIDKLISAWNRHLNPDSDPVPEPADPGPAPSSALSLAVLDQFHFVIVPVANPDGYAYSMSRDRLWRKTRSRNESAPNHRWCVGADANRNWAYRWAVSGASRSPCSQIFPGWAPFSEPEVRALRDYLEPDLDRLVAFVSLHSYGQLILSSWGFSHAKPANHGEQQKVAELAIGAIRRATGAEYSFGSIADLLYPAAGTSIDYWQHRGVPYIYGVELRPEDGESELHGFAIGPEQIEPSGEEMWTMIKQIVEYVSEEQRRGKKKRMEERWRGEDEEEEEWRNQGWMKK